MGQIKQRIKLNDFLAVKSRIYEIIDEIDQLNQEATKLAETLATNDYRGRSWTHYAYDKAVQDAIGCLRSTDFNHISSSKTKDQAKAMRRKIVEHGLWADFYKHLDIWTILGESKKREFFAMEQHPWDLPDFNAHTAEDTLTSIHVNRGQLLYERILDVFDARSKVHKTGQVYQIGSKIIFLDGYERDREIRRMEVLVHDILGLPLEEGKSVSHHAAMHHTSGAYEHGPLRAVKYKNGNVHVYFTKAGERARSVMNEVLATFSKGHNAERLK